MMESWSSTTRLPTRPSPLLRVSGLRGLAAEARADAEQIRADLVREARIAVESRSLRLRFGGCGENRFRLDYGLGKLTECNAGIAAESRCGRCPARPVVAMLTFAMRVVGSNHRERFLRCKNPNGPTQEAM